MKIKDIIFKIKSVTFEETLEYIEENARKKVSKRFVVTINTELVMLAKKDSEYDKILNSADLAVVDGIGVVWAGKMFGKQYKGRVHGSDLVERVSEAVAKKPITVGFLGGQGNVAQQTAECLKNKYPGLKVAFAIEEADRLQTTDHSNEAISVDLSPKSVSRIKCDILFVAFGSPKQEFWIAENLAKIDVKVAMGVGGAFDFISGKVRRAPVWMRKIGLEWLFRLIIQPWRIKRQFALVKFVVIVIKEKLGL
jgi:N-acetylglucosaminyldiphosphoundecaprenol N-acetyl-beta-D-mannosaminyltransferase